MAGNKPGFVIICDGLRVARAPTRAKAESLAGKFARQYPSDMIFSVQAIDGQSISPSNSISQKRGQRP